MKSKFDNLIAYCVGKGIEIDTANMSHTEISTIFNKTVKEAAQEIDNWHKQQQTALIDKLVAEMPDRKNHYAYRWPTPQQIEKAASSSAHNQAIDEVLAVLNKYKESL